MRLRTLRKPRRAAVFGCGPAGLFAAHALAQVGWEFDIFSRRRRSEIYGAQYLHQPIPGLPEVKGEVRYVFEGGTVEDYLHKVYGAVPALGELRWAMSTLGEDPRPAWDLRAAYAAAWETYWRSIKQAELSPAWLMGGCKAEGVDLARYELFISTVPVTVLCWNSDGSHHFRSQKVWAVGDAPERGVFCPVQPREPGTIVYNASRDTGWYRTSNIFGYTTAEWPEARKPPVEGIAEVNKPLNTSCDCWIGHPRFFRVGRYGAWDKAQNTHHAYLRTRELVS